MQMSAAAAVRFCGSPGSLPPELLEHDIAGDWVEALQGVCEEGLRNFEEAFTPRPDIAVPDTQRAIILQGAMSPSEEGAAAERPDPCQDLPEILARPLTKKEHEAVLACLSALSVNGRISLPTHRHCSKDSVGEP
jgi:hypothetical protein